MEKITFTNREKERLDKALAKKLQKPRNQIEQLIKQGYVRINGKIEKKAGSKLKSGDLVEVTIPEPKVSQPKDVHFDVERIYEDEDILVLNKPAGLVVHPAPSVKEPTLVDWLKANDISLSTLSGEERHGIVHRLDKETSGLIVIAKNNETHQALSKQLQDKSMGRYYLAIVEPPLKEDLIIEKPIARNPKNRLKMGVVEGGRYAKSAFVKLTTSKNNKYELIGAKLFTGRTHQIRVHLASINRHILGDSLYGFKSKSVTIPRVFLHAYILYLKHPKSGEKMRFLAPVPEDMLDFLQKYFEENIDETIHVDSFIGRFASF
ncbi:ribosomal large subunit pseudouridine synthase D [Nitratiruptor sp. SB155-2]|nr:RluA family pseudouridine synthase [Nitratiruptor sp. SB155-2]BAF69864.1 ribosomal large subunit pseudouridine synthase D [Nitratiruptor sp. SB155-2]